MLMGVWNNIVCDIAFVLLILPTRFNGKKKGNNRE